MRQALADLLRFGGAAGFRWPPRRGVGAPWPPGEAALLDLVLACAVADGARAREALARAGPLESALRPCLDQAWWAGAGAFLSARLAALELGDGVPAGLRGALLAEELVCRRRHAHARVHVPALLVRLERAGLRPVLLKGLVHAMWLYPEPWCRPGGDADLLLRADELAAARELLVAEGFVPSPTPVRHAGAPHHHGPPLARRVDGLPLVVELHAALAPLGCAGDLRAEALVDRSVPLDLSREPGAAPVAVAAGPAAGGTGAAPAATGPRPVVRALAVDDRVAHIALHHPGELTLRRLLDILLAAREAGPSGLGRARRSIDRASRWQLDFVASMAGQLLAAPLERVTPRITRALRAVSCTQRWALPHLEAARRGGGAPARPWAADAGPGGAFARPGRAALDRLVELGAAILPVLSREPRRRALAALRLLREGGRAAAEALGLRARS